MKKLLVIIIMMFLIFSVSQAQKYNRGFITAGTPDTLAGADTNLYAFPEKITKYSGQVSFTFNFTNIEDSVNNNIMQGSMNNVDWVDVVTVTIVHMITDSTIIDLNPAYLYYRQFVSTAAGDSVQIDAVNFVYKEE